MIANILLGLAVLSGIFFLLPTLAASLYSRSHIFAIEDSPEAPVAIVFGAGLQRDGTPSPVLRDRVVTAAQLYFAGKVQVLLMSGDNRYDNYNEPAAMKTFALQLGVPEKAIVMDYAGRRTYDTCYRAREIFGVHQALLITQQYHQPRALLTCSALGITAAGIPADRRVYSQRAHQFWKMREVPATLVAMVDVWFTHPIPVLGDPQPISINASLPGKPTNGSQSLN